MRLSADEKLRREIAVLYDVLSEALGTEKVVMRAGKLGTLKEMRSQAIPDRLLALQRLVFEDPTLETRPAKAQYKKRHRRDRGPAGRPRRPAHRRRQPRGQGQRQDGRAPRRLPARAAAGGAARGGRPRDAGHPGAPGRPRSARRARAGPRRARRAAPQGARPGGRPGVGDQGADRQAGLALPAARDPLRPARGRQDHRRAAGAGAGQGAARTRRSRPTRRSSRRPARRCAGTPARPPTRCWAACTTRSTRAPGATSPTAACPSPSWAW